MDKGLLECNFHSQIVINCLTSKNIFCKNMCHKVSLRRAQHENSCDILEKFPPELFLPNFRTYQSSRKVASLVS